MTGQQQHATQVEARDPQAHPSYPVRHPKAARPIFLVVDEELDAEEPASNTTSDRVD